MIACLALAACVGKDSVPSDVIKPDSMKSVVWDMIQADQYVKLYLVKDSCDIDVHAETIRLYQEIFRLHHVTQQEFARSYQFYLAHEDLNKLIFDSLAEQNKRARHQQFNFPKSKLIPKARR